VAHPSIVIVGAGFSGLMTAFHLVDQAQEPIFFTLLDSAPEIGIGLAYATPDHAHLLNVRASRMGAIAGKPGHFWEWLSARPEGKDYTPDSFVPRAIYGNYLRDLRELMLDSAALKGIRITHVLSNACSVMRQESGFSVKDSDGHTFAADAVVLASGNPMPDISRMIPGAESLNSNTILPSAWDAAALEAHISRLPPEGTLFILGAGLTMVDTVLTLYRSGFRGRMVALSRHGHLPLPHRDDLPLPGPSITAVLGQQATSARQMLRALRLAIRQQGNAGEDWRNVIDGLRADTVALWQSLPPIEQKRFFRHLFSMWNIHRHRMAPDVWRIMQHLQESGKLTLCKGRVVKVAQVGQSAEVTWRRRYASTTESLLAHGVILCAGPGYDFARGGSPLYGQLIKDHLLIPHRSGMGVDDAISGVFLIGTPLIGQRLETTAVPELREQAYEVARSLLAYLVPATR
jgi:uncharacterized NAD(P)/FAD-binding protein YdhS